MTSDAILQRMGMALRSIGYRDGWLLSNYEYADVAGDSYAVRAVAMAAFAQLPPSYRNACIGVITANGVSGAAHIQQHRALGAPMIFEINNTGIDRWKVTRSGQPEFIELKRADIVLCNPPFEDFTLAEREKYGGEVLVQKPAELLRRILNRPPALLGFVLPLIFNTGNSYRDFHYRLARSYGRIELVSLPEVFNYSDVTTVLLLASEQREKKLSNSSCLQSLQQSKLGSLFQRGRRTGRRNRATNCY